MKAAVQKLDLINSEDVMTIAESLIQEGREAGLQEGRLESQIETAISLFELGFSLDLIRSVTKLPDPKLGELFPNL